MGKQDELRQASDTQRCTMPEIRKTGLRIVVVEDSPVVRDILFGALESIPGTQLAGYAASEEEAKQTLRKIRPELAIVDLELASGTGMGVLGAVQGAPQEFGNPTMVVFSNYAHPAIQQRCRVLGAQAFFDKAFQMDELFDFVKALAESSPPACPAHN